MTKPTTRTPGIEAPAAGPYRLDPARSSVAFRTRHLFGLGRVAGTLQLVAGELVVDPMPPHASVSVTLDAASFDTGNDRRDRDVREVKFLDTVRHPRITFHADELRQEGGGWTLAGQLTVRGVSRPVTLAIGSVERSGRGFRAHASARVDRYAFGITAAKGMAARFLDVEVTVVAEPTT